jgi:hypothetical protein
MKIISIVSPDRLSIASFLSFMRHHLGKDYVFGELHNLMSEEAIVNYITDLITLKETVIFSYYAKKQINVDPMKVIPSKLLEVSDLLVWIDLYTMDWKVIKDTENVSGSFLTSWSANISRMSVN